MGKPNIIANDVSKKFGLSLNNALKYGLIDTARRLIGLGKDAHLRSGEFWALDGVNFNLMPGDALGIMGINGSGKTTLLRIFNGTYSPDRGSVTLRGSVGALIAAGAGFSPMLTGRENVFVSAALLGMTYSETRKKFDEIVGFSELEKFIDMPVRNYSSGMAVRLGFAIAVLGRPEILLVDEVLAVGDISFQKKCYERIHAIKKEGTTILLVSHSPGAIWMLCNHGLVLHEGKTSGLIPVEEACKLYEHYNMIERMKQSNKNDERLKLSKDYGGTRGGTGDAFINRVEILDETLQPVTALPFGASFILRYHFNTRKHIHDAILRVLIDSEINKAIVVIDNYEQHGSFFDFSPGDHVMDIVVNNPSLRPGVYFFSAAIVQKNVGVHLFYEQNHARLMISHREDLFLYADFQASYHVNAIYKYYKNADDKDMKCL